MKLPGKLIQAFDEACAVDNKTSEELFQIILVAYLVHKSWENSGDWKKYHKAFELISQYQKETRKESE